MPDKPVAIVVGASRGIGRQVAIDLAANGYAVVVAAKSTTTSPPAGPAAAAAATSFPPDPDSPQSTISTVAREITLLGGQALAVPVDVRYPQSIEALVARTISTFGRLDVLVYNAGAIYWASVANTPLERFQLMQRVNPEGLYAAVQFCLPHFSAVRGDGAADDDDDDATARARGTAGRIIVVSPPIYSRFFRGKTAYAMGKVGMSVLTKGLAMDFARDGAADMAICSIWPAVAIRSAATARFTATDAAEAAHLRKPTIFSDAILGMLRAPASLVNGQLFLDEDFLRDHCHVTDFAQYSVVPGARPRRIMPARLPDLTVAEQDDEGQRIDLARSKI